MHYPYETSYGAGVRQLIRSIHTHGYVRGLLLQALDLLLNCHCSFRCSDSIRWSSSRCAPMAALCRWSSSRLAPAPSPMPPPLTTLAAAPPTHPPPSSSSHPAVGHRPPDVQPRPAGNAPASPRLCCRPNRHHRQITAIADLLL